MMRVESKLEISMADSAELIAAYRKQLHPRMKRIAEAMKVDVKRSMKKVAPVRGPRGGLRQIPSPPGTPPNRQTSVLHDSIYVKERDGDFYIGTDVPYGDVHENGGRHHPLRPFLEPQRKRYQALINQLLRGTDFSGINVNNMIRRVRTRKV